MSCYGLPGTEHIKPIQAIFNLHGEMYFTLATQPTPLQSKLIRGTKIRLKGYSSYSLGEHAQKYI